MNTILTITLTLLLLTSTVFANEQKGLEIATKMDKASNGFIGESSVTELIIISANKEKVSRKMQNFLIEVKNDGDRSLSIFITPADVRDTKLLSWNHLEKDDKQWLYLPSSRRVKRINGSSKSSSFMGSEFTFEDLTTQELPKFKYNLVSETKTEWLLEKTPIRKSGYKSQKHWINKKYLQAVKVEYYDRKGELLKVATTSKFKQFNVGGKKFWRPGEIHIKNVQTLRESILKWSERKVGVKLPLKKFNKKSLK